MHYLNYNLLRLDPGYYSIYRNLPTAYLRRYWVEMRVVACPVLPMVFDFSFPPHAPISIYLEVEDSKEST